MTALAANRSGTYWHALGPVTQNQMKLPVEAGEILYRGALCHMIPTAGGLMPAADTANAVFTGICLEYVTNVGGADGAVDGLVYMGPALILLTLANALEAGAEGTLLYATDDQTLDIVATTTNDVLIGRAMRLVTTTSWWVLVNASAIGM